MSPAERYRSSSPAPPLGPPLVITALRHAAAHPDRPAVVDGATGERFSRAELAERSAALAAGLAERGVGRGDIVAVALPNVASWPIVALAVWRTGAGLSALAPFPTAEETERMLARVPPRIAIASGLGADSVQRALAAAGIAAEVFAAERQAQGATPLERLCTRAGEHPFAEPRLDPGDLALVAFSGGIGGLPRGVRLTHGNLTAAVAQVADSFAAAERSTPTRSFSAAPPSSTPRASAGRSARRSPSAPRSSRSRSRSPSESSS